jgi:hypothetical protein
LALRVVVTKRHTPAIDCVVCRGPETQIPKTIDIKKFTIDTQKFTIVGIFMHVGAHLIGVK